MKARAALRAATAADHERVDALFSRFDLERDYGRFLQAQAAAFLPVEEALDRSGIQQWLDDWPARRRGHLVARDLETLGLSVPNGITPPDFPDSASALGAVYVLEGSRLGGALLKRQLPEAAPRAFLDADQEPGSWRKLLEMLDIFLYRTGLLDTAAGSARAVFQRFEAGGLQFVETTEE